MTDITTESRLEAMGRRIDFHLEQVKYNNYFTKVGNLSEMDVLLDSAHVSWVPYQKGKDGRTTGCTLPNWMDIIGFRHH